MVKTVGILTSGGDSPGLNAAIRGVGKAAIGAHGMHVIGYRDGFRGLVENRSAPLTRAELSGILTIGGTILGTSRDKPHRMPVGKKTMDMTDVIVETYQRHHLDALVCIGGGGTQKNAQRLVDKGLNIVTLPKTIDNDVEGTDITFGFDTALGIATDAIDRLHSTAHSHHRIIVVEVMGHNAGWLALGAGIAGGADVILIPEIAYSLEAVCAQIEERRRRGRNFSIVVVAESVRGPVGETITYKDAHGQSRYGGIGALVAHEIGQRTGAETRVTVLGHVQRGGTPTPRDRILATRYGLKAADLVYERRFGTMAALRGDDVVEVSLRDAVAELKTVPPEFYEAAKTFFG